MAGFYGRVTNGLPVPLTLDKIYSNRVNMRNGAMADGVWAGRYVLVSYNEPDKIELASNPNYYVNTTFDAQDNPIYDEQEVYNTNYLKDKNHGYPNLGQGYDATVWRKVVDNQGNHTYALVAQLNAIIPTFGLVIEPPSNEPTTPFFGVDDATSVYYPLHMAGEWGFRIANAPVTEDDKVLSDFLVEDQVEYSIDGDVIIQIPKDPYHGAIFFNKDGFDSNETHRINGIDNEISLHQVESGTEYGVSNQVALDTQELQIILPALGNAVSDMYDLLYGPSDETPTGKRYKNTSWDDANARNNETRSTTRGLTYYKEPPYLNPTTGAVIRDGINRSGFAPVEAFSLAGTINSVHDMLGMIITASERPVDASAAYADQIYYVGYQLTEHETRDPDTKYYRYNETTRDFEPYPTTGVAWDPSTAYEFVDTYYCVVETPQYQRPIEFEEGDFSLTPSAFKTKYKDSEIPYPSTEFGTPRLAIYPGGKYIKTDDTPTYQLAEAPKTDFGGAQAGITYYDLPPRLTYAGTMVTSKDNTYYSRVGEASAPYASAPQIVPDEDGEWVIRTNNDMILYQIQPDTEVFHANETYWIMNPDQTGYYRARTTAATFEADVLNGLYKNAEMSVKLINTSGSTRFKVHYTTRTGQDRLQDLYGLGGDGAYVAALRSEVAFINFITQHISNISDADAVDIDYLYIDNNLEPTADGGYSNNYRPYPISRFLFAESDTNDTRYYKDVYTKNGDNFERVRMTSQLDNVADTTIYRLSLSQEKLFEGGWVIQASPEQMMNLRTQRRNQVLTSINTADYDISYIYWLDKDYFNPDAIYWELDGDFTVAGYGVSSTNTPEDEEKEQSGKPIYYAPNAMYYKDAADDFVLADDGYVYDGTTILYRVNELIIVDRGDIDELRLYSRWDNNLIQTTSDIAYFFRPVASGGHGVQLAHKYIGAAWKEMPGFARNLNTIHGWIIKLNQLLNTTDVRSRDLNTYQGCINTIKDILAKFGDFTPGGYLHVNRYGQVETVSTVTPDISGALSTVSASFNVSNNGLNLNLTQTNGQITAFGGSIGAITYIPREWDETNSQYTNAATTSSMTLSDALALISELQARIEALENN